MDVTQRNLALEFNIIKLDFFQDWLNGSLYMPLWFWRKRRKKSYLFGLIRRSAKNDFCSCEKKYSHLKTYVTCAFDYGDNSLKLTKDKNPETNKRWHRTGKKVRFNRGVIRPFINKDDLTVYYYSPLECRVTENTTETKLERIKTPFEAVRLYATDIILLGNLNEQNIYGIPQFFKVLPSTTANVPPIATIKEASESQEENDKENDNDAAYDEDSGQTITTGMDWGRHGNKDTPIYKNG